MTSKLSCIWEQRFSRLHTRLFPKLVSFLSSRVPSQEAEEIAQEALLKVYQQLQLALTDTEKWPDEHLSALAFTVAKNLVISRARHLKVRWQYLEQQRDDMATEPPATAEQSVINEDMNQHLLTAINRLPAICRNVFILRKIHNKSYKDIADELNISVKTVENHLAKGMRLCQQYVIESVTKEAANNNMVAKLCK